MLQRETRSVYEMSKKVLYAVICLHHTLEYTKQPYTNIMLEELQVSLRKELRDYDKIYIAFVYEGPNICVREFRQLKTDSPVVYKQPCAGATHQLAHIMLRGMSLLKELQDEGKRGEKRLYLLTEEKIQRSQAGQIVCETGEGIRVHPFFEDLEFTPCMITTQQGDGGLLERYFQEYGRMIHVATGKNRLGE